MPYDPTDFITGLEKLQTDWLERRMHLTGPCRKDWGWVQKSLDVDNIPPQYSLGGTWDPKSNHAKIEKSVWEQKLNATLEAMDANLRSIPAFDFPEFYWGISFRKGNGQADYNLEIIGTPIGKRYLKSIPTARKRLKAIGHDLSGMPHGADLKIFKVGPRHKMRAETGIAALRLRLAIAGTNHKAFVEHIKKPLDAIHPPLAA